MDDGSSHRPRQKEGVKEGGEGREGGREGELAVKGTKATRE